MAGGDRFVIDGGRVWSIRDLGGSESDPELPREAAQAECAALFAYLGRRWPLAHGASLSGVLVHIIEVLRAEANASDPGVLEDLGAGETVSEPWDPGVDSGHERGREGTP